MTFLVLFHVSLLRLGVCDYSPLFELVLFLDLQFVHSLCSYCEALSETKGLKDATKKTKGIFVRLFF